MATSLRVLILEDRAADAELMVHELRRAGFTLEWQRVETEADYAARLAQIPDVILADYNLPQFDALRALGVLQESGLDIPLLVVTGSINEEVAVQCIKQGAADYLLKDRLTRLGSAVTQALEQKTLRDERRRADAHLRRLNEVLRAIRSVNQLIVRERDAERLLAGACASLVRARGYRLVWVGRVEAGHKRVLPVARAGQGVDFLSDILVTWDDSETGRGPVGTALRTRQPATVQDIASDPQFTPWKEAALSRGHASVASVPVVHGGRLFGALTVHADQPHAFDEDEIGLLVELADDLGLALRSIEDETERKRQEEQLRLQAAALGAAANAILITDREGHIIWANPALTRLTGYAFEEVLGQNPRLLKSGEHERFFYQHLWETILAGRVWQGEIINRRKDGSFYTEEMTITPVPDDRDAITHFIAIKQDVTARKRAEEEVRSAARFPSENPGPVLRLSHDGTILYANEASGALLQDWGCAVGGLAPTSWREVVGEVLASNSRKIIDVPCGGLIYSFFVAPFPDAGYVNLYGRDITERKQAEEALATRTLQLETVRAVTAEITQELELATLLRLINRRAGEMVGALSAALLLWDETAQVLVPQVWHGHGDRLRGIHFRLGEGLAGEAAERREGLVVNDYPAYERTHPVVLKHSGITAAIAAPLLYRNRLLGVIKAIQEGPGRGFTEEDKSLLTLFASQAAIAIENARLYQEVQRHAAHLEARVVERTQELEVANSQLESASRRKSEFLANMSHELRTPLNSILGFGQLLMEQTGETLSPKQTRFLTHIYNSGQHLLQLINDILDLSKVEAGKFVLQPERLPVAETLEDILVIARGLANRKGQTIRQEIARDLPWLHADPVRFKQILFNVLSNAVKFTPERGTITVRAYQQAVSRGQEAAGSGQVAVTTEGSPLPAPDCPLPALAIEVTDTGIGIKAEDLPRLFQEFVQLEGAKSQEGTGLGLALTKRLVEMHGGRISAESAGEGQGCTFTVVLPFAGAGRSPAS